MERKRFWLKIYLILQILALIFWCTFGFLVILAILMLMYPSEETLLQNPETMREYILSDLIPYMALFVYVFLSEIYSSIATKKLLSNKPLVLLDKISLFSGVISNGFIYYYIIFYFVLEYIKYRFK